MDIVAKQYLDDQNKGDTAFTGPGTLMQLFFGGGYSQKEMRDTWFLGIEHGFELGIDYGSPKGRILQLTNNIENENDAEFFKKFLAICQEHNVRITYHPRKGMVFEQLDPNL